MPASDINIRCQGVDNEYIAISTDNLPADPYDVIYLLKAETAGRGSWRDVAVAYFRQGSWKAAVTVLEEATGEDVETVLRGAAGGCTRMHLLAVLAGIHVMVAGATGPDREDALRSAGVVFSRADKIDLDDPAIWVARGWAEFYAGKLDTAKDWFDNARDKSHVLGALGLAAICLNKGEVSGGVLGGAGGSGKDPVALLVSAVGSRRCPPGVWIALGYALFREARFKVARKVAKRAISAVADADKAERRDALYLLSLVEVTDARETSLDTMTAALREAYVECDGDEDPRILALMADLAFNGGEFENSRRLAQRAVTAADTLPGAAVGPLFASIQRNARAMSLFQLARAQHHLGQNDDSIHNFEQIKLMLDDPDSGSHLRINPGVYLRLGLLKLATGRKEDEAVAQECLEKVLKNASERCGVAMRALGVLLGRRVLMGLRRGRPRGGEMFQRAVTLLKKGILEDAEDGKRDVPAQLIYAGLVEESTPQLSLEAYQSAVESLTASGSDVDPEIWNNMSSILARLGRFKEAREMSLTKIDDEYASECNTVAYNRARLAEMDGDVEDAKRRFENIQDGDLHHVEAKTRLGFILMKIEGKAAESEQLFKEAMEDPTTRSVAAAYLSALYGDQKRFKEAQDILEGTRHECDYLALSFSRFMHRFLDSLETERRGRFLINHIGTPLINILKRSKHNSFAANGVGVFFAESNMIPEAREAFAAAGAGPLIANTARVNLAHTQILQGRKSLRSAAEASSRPDPKVISNGRALFDQAEKLYSDALKNTSLDGGRKQLTAYTELLQYIAWAQFEVGEYRSSADTLTKLLHFAPQSCASYFNLGQALLDSACARVVRAKSRYDEMLAAKTEFEGSRFAFVKCRKLFRGQIDPLTRTRVDHKLVDKFIYYVGQEGKKHNVNVINAKDQEEDRKAKREENLKKVAELERREKQKVLLEEQKKKAQQEAIEKAAREAAEKLQRAEEFDRAERAAKQAQEEEEDDVIENGEGQNGTGPKPKRKRKRREQGDAESVSKPKRKKPVKGKPAKSSARPTNASSDEYSDGAVSGEEASQKNESGDDRMNDGVSGSSDDAAKGERRVRERGAVISDSEEDSDSDPLLPIAPPVSTEASGDVDVEMTDKS